MVGGYWLLCSTLAEVCGDGAKVLPILVLEQYNAVVQMLLMSGIYEIVVLP